MSSAVTDSNDSSASLTPSVLAACAVVLVLVWGTAFTMTSVAVKTITPIWLVAGRCLIGATLLTLWALYKKERLPRLTDTRWVWYAVLGFTGMVAPFYLFSRGQIVIDSGLAGITAGTMPLITIVLAHFFAGERLNLQKTVGFLVGFCGLIILFLPDDFSLALTADWQSQGLLLGGAFCYAITTIIAKHAPATPSVSAAAMMVICAAIMACIAAVFTAPLPALTPAGGLLILGLGAGSTGVATILFLFLIKRSGPSTIAKINYFPPVVSVTAGIILLGEPFTPKLVIAFIVIVCGLLIARGLRAKARA